MALTYVWTVGAVHVRGPKQKQVFALLGIYHCSFYGRSFLNVQMNEIRT